MEPIADIPFEQALTEFEQVVEKLESGSLSLEETMTLYQRGRDLAGHCQQLLDKAELKVKELVSSIENGAHNAVDFDPGA